MQTNLLALALGVLVTACSPTTTTSPPAATPAAAAHATGAAVPAPSANPGTAAALADAPVYELAARRAQMLEWLRAYREAGSFPTDAAGFPASVFMDARGVRCPMAELMHKSGRDDLVAAVVAEDNTARLADVHDGPLADWMAASGLTMAEINLVQGAMNVDYRWMREIEIPGEQPQIMAARGQVRGKLETAEIALRDNTGTSLAQAAKRLPGANVDALAHAPIPAGARVLGAPPAIAQPAIAQPAIAQPAGRPVAQRFVLPPGTRVLRAPVTN